MKIEAPRLHGRLLMYVAALATIVIYWAGLGGPFLLDDMPSLNPLQRWLDGRASAMELVLGNTSGELGRPVSMVTLWASAASGGLHPFPFKLGNLLIHIVCGFVGWQLLRALLAQDARFARHANEIAAVLAGLWLLHPINVSTVLYAVQRMAQLSTLFVLLAVWAYVVARRQLAEGDTRAGARKLFMLFPLLLLAGMLSKENAAVAPALCLIVELAYFLRQPRTGKALPAFFTIFLLLPVLAGVALLVLAPDRLLSGYAVRDFTLWERLLSQPRALMEYIGLYLWPRGGMMGVFVDDFRASTGLLSPISTLWSLLALLGISAFAVATRTRAPTIFAGWFFFLVAHGIESSFLPLELYFEHRNYLPGFGLLLSIAGVLSWAKQRLPVPPAGQSRLAWALVGITVLGFSLVTRQQVQVWRSTSTIIAQALVHRPDSTRAQLAKLGESVQAQRWDEVDTILSRLRASDEPQRQFLGTVHGIAIDCLRGNPPSRHALQSVENIGIKRVTFAEVQAFTPLSLALGQGRCRGGLDEAALADTIVRVLDGTQGQPATSRPKWLMRYSAADLYQRAERWEDAQMQAELAWIPGASDTAIGAMLVRLHIRNGDKQAAQRTLDEARARVSRYEKVANAAIQLDQAAIDSMPH